MLAEIREVVRRIPRGKVSTYGEIASMAGHPGAARQVVWALRGCGPDVPWHRVVAAGGRIALPAEAGMEQILRLQQEGVALASGKVRMDLHAFRPK
jgi:methylated-DNA-protein-cysteine methyltransferase-like protein